MTGGHSASYPELENPRSQTLDRRAWVVIGALMLATVLANVASVCLFPQIVALSQEFARPVNQVVWAMAAFHVVATGLGGVAAALGASLGNRRMLLVVLGLLLAGSVMAAASTDLPLLVAGRVVQGAAMATQALAIGIVAHLWRGEAARKAMSMIVLAMALGAVVGYLSSGVIWKVGGNWRTIFWALAAASALDLVLSGLFLKETPRKHGVRVDYAGCMGLVAWAVLILLPLSQANAWGWGSFRLLSLLVPGVVVLSVWVAWELEVPAPLIDVRLLRRQGIWQGGIVWLAIAIGLCVPASAMPYLFQAPVISGYGFGRSMFVVSVASAIPAALMSVTASFAAHVMRHLGARGTMLLGLLFGWSAFGLAFAHGSLGLTMMWMALAGIPGALAGSASFALAAEMVAPEQGIVVSTIYNAAAGSGSAVASALTGFVLTLRQVELPVKTADGIRRQLFPDGETFTWAALIAAGMAVLATVVTLSLWRRPR